MHVGWRFFFFSPLLVTSFSSHEASFWLYACLTSSFQSSSGVYLTARCFSHTSHDSSHLPLFLISSIPCSFQTFAWNPGLLTCLTANQQPVDWPSTQTSIQVSPGSSPIFIFIACQTRKRLSDIKLTAVFCSKALQTTTLVMQLKKFPVVLQWRS